MADPVLEAQQHAAKGDHAKAAKLYEKALRKKDGEGKIWIRFAESLRKCGREEEAVEAFRTAADRFASVGQTLQAIGVCRMILQIDPQHAEARTRLAEWSSDRLSEGGSSGSLQGARNEILAKLKLKQVARPADEPQAKVVAMEEPVEPEPTTADDEPEELDILEELHHPAAREKLEGTRLFVGIDLDALDALLAELPIEAVEAGATLIREGDDDDAFYVVSSGRFVVEKERPEGAVQLATLLAGDFFGEFAVLTGTPRTATVRALEPAEVVVFRRPVFDALVAQFPSLSLVLEQFFRQRMVGTLIRTSPLLSGLGDQEREHVLRAFEACEWAPGTVLVRQGDPGDSLYVILLGEVAVEAVGKDGFGIEVARLGQGDFFGEISLLTGKPATATCTVTRPTRGYRLTAKTFRDLMEYFPAVRRSVAAIAKQRVVATHAQLQGAAALDDPAFV